MIYNTRNWSNNTIENQKERPALMLVFSTVSQNHNTKYFVLITLRMASLNILSLCSVGQQT